MYTLHILVSSAHSSKTSPQVHDKEENVAVQAVKLISFMLNSFDVLEDSDCEVLAKVWTEFTILRTIIRCLLPFSEPLCSAPGL